MSHGEMFGHSHPQHLPSSYTFFPSHSSYGTGPSHMFGTSAMIPPSVHYPGSSSSMPFYSPPMPFQTPQTTVHRPQFSQSDQDEDDDEPHQQQPLKQPTRPRKRYPCDTLGHI